MIETSMYKFDYRVFPVHRLPVFPERGLFFDHSQEMFPRYYPHRRRRRRRRRGWQGAR